MLLQINKIKIYTYIFAFIFLTTISNINFHNLIKEKFLIDNIQIKTNKLKADNKILDKLKILQNTNILSLKKPEILSILDEFKFLENINIKKIYPSTIVFQANKTSILAITFINQKKFYVGNNGEFISPKYLQIKKKLPIIFGNFETQDFLFLINLLKKNKVKYQKINKYYYHKSKRWDLHFDNNIQVKLPNNNIINAVEIYKKFLNNNPEKSNLVIDLRVNNRIILTNE